MTKLNIYRAFLLTMLMSAAYGWPIIGIVIIGWWAGALIGFLTKRATPPEWQNQAFQIGNSAILALLSVWLGLWNGFYVWKGLNHEYWNKS